MNLPQPNRRDFLHRIGAAAGAFCLFGNTGTAATSTHHTPRASRLLYLHMSGGPSQHDLFDHKPALQRWHGSDLPDSVRQGQRITTMTSGQSRLRICASPRRFAARGRCGAWLSDLLPHLAQAADELCIVRSMQTDAINHEPAINLVQTGSELPGRPCLGAWLSHALGTQNRDLPAFVVLHSSWSGPKVDQPLYSRLWGAGFLPAEHQGVLLRSTGDPVLFLRDEADTPRAVREAQLQALARLHAHAANVGGDGGPQARQAQAELAFRMQTSVPELVDLADENGATRERYGPHALTRGTFANNALLARRMLERGVRVVQIYHRGWDQHRELDQDLPRQCADVDQPIAALLHDLRVRGLLDDTLVVWHSEFGRTVYAQGEFDGKHGRDHHPRCFTSWLAGGGTAAGAQVGETDELGYNVVRDGVHVHDLNATMLHLFGFDHERLTVQHEGRAYRLTDVHGRVVPQLLA